MTGVAPPYLLLQLARPLTRCVQQHEGTASDVAISLEDPSREGFCPYVVGSQIRIAPPTGICNPLNHVFPLATCQARRTAQLREVRAAARLRCT